MYNEVLECAAKNLRFLGKTMPKPGFIFKPIDESHVQASVICSKKLGIHPRFRSGGHDYEGLSYGLGSKLVLLLVNFTTGLQKRAKFMACSSVGIGGQITGGAYGTMMRKHGLGGDNMLDAKMIDAIIHFQELEITSKYFE
ncbi:hypothetical protein F2Q68_00010701 [Brassica cretica]|nr:hypothetical protein F2Q68_00010701 [Brassica cretica]